MFIQTRNNILFIPLSLNKMHLMIFLKAIISMLLNIIMEASKDLQNT